MAQIEAENALKRLTNHPQEHGFGLKPHNRSVIEAQRTLDKTVEQLDQPPLALDQRQVAQVVNPTWDVLKDHIGG